MLERGGELAASISVSLFEKHHYSGLISKLWSLRLVKMNRNIDAAVKVCEIKVFNQPVLRNGVQHSCVAKQN
jgi:hypothetical protein